MGYFDETINKISDIMVEATKDNTNCKNCGAILTDTKCTHCGTTNLFNGKEASRIQFKEEKYEPIDKIQMKNINQVYVDKKGVENVVFKDFNIDIKDIRGGGQFTVIVGASGCGKSTLLRYIAGLQKPTSGEIFVNGQLRTSQDRVGMVFQQYSSLPWATVLQNVALPLELQGVAKAEREERAMEMIKIVNLEGHEHKFAQYPILSGGQLQRVAIARSLIANNEMLLLDEPFGALDINTRLRMQDMLIDIWGKVKGDPTFILVTHDLSEAVYLADEIYVLKANPGEVHEFIDLDMPMKRDASIKRTPRFMEYVHYLEDIMMKINTNK
jgi:NitT/TauT family transport system ATP-binding protein